MEAIGFVLGFLALGLLALRFGKDSREGLRSPEQDLAARGMNWADLATDQRSPIRQAASLPTLSFIERALASPGALTARPDGASLEVRARVLTAAYWSDLGWITGIVPEPAFRRVLDELDPALAGAPVVEVERSIEIVESIERPCPVVASEPQLKAAVVGSAAMA
jgi:hypothetical protein